MEQTTKEGRLWTHEQVIVTCNPMERAPSSLPTRTRMVLLPKFKLEKNYNLVEALKSMGITELFDKNGNMSGISDQSITIDLVTIPFSH